MRKLEIAGRTITDDDCFVIAEIGSNHGGDPDLCERMIVTAARCGVDAVKMQKRDNAAMFTKTMLATDYRNDDSFGNTYGEHRAALDWFGEKEFIRFKAVAEKHGVIFFATPFEEKSADFLLKLGVPLWKIASCDVTNLPLIKTVAGYGKPIIASTGGASLLEIELMAEEIEKAHSNYALLQCTSVYKNVTDEMMNLAAITTLRHAFPENIVGISSHHPGILPLVVARTLGAAIFEVHFTLNRNSKGTDHKFAMEPKGLAQICEDLPRVKTMLGSAEKTPLLAEKQGFITKMGKGIYVNHAKKAGEILEIDDICIKSPAGGLNPGEIGDILGGILINDVSTGVPLERGMVE